MGGRDRQTDKGEREVNRVREMGGRKMFRMYAAESIFFFLDKKKKRLEFKLNCHTISTCDPLIIYLLFLDY